MLNPPKAETEVTTHRIESFSDDVFTIAITLLIGFWPLYFGKLIANPRLGLVPVVGLEPTRLFTVPGF